MPKWRLATVLLVMVTSVILAVGCSSGGFLAEFSTIERDPPIDLHDLLVPPSVLPIHWEPGRIESSPRGASDHIGDEDLQANFVTNDPSGRSIGGVRHRVYRFRNSALAARQFERMKGDTILFFEGGEWNQPPPPEWQVVERSADEQYSRCREVYLTYHCGELARYEEFVSVFSANVILDTPNMNPAYFTMEDLEVALNAIDKQFVQVLEQTTTTP